MSLSRNVPNFLFPYARPELALCVDVHLKVFLLNYLVSAVYRASLYTRLEAKKMKFRGDESKTQSDLDSSEDCRSKQVTKKRKYECSELLKESLWLWDLAALFCPWAYDQRQILTRQCRILNNILALKTYFWPPSSGLLRLNFSHAIFWYDERTQTVEIGSWFT